MYKYYRKNFYTIMEYDFESISEFLDYLDNTPVNTNIWGNSKLASEAKEYNFCKTKSLKDAKELAKYGYNENFERFIELKDKLNRFIKLSSKKSKPFNYYIGYAPDVKAYLEGSPLSMLNKTTPEKKLIDIYFNASYNCETETSQIINRGIITLSIVDILEKLGFTVNLNVFNMAREWNEVHYAVFRLKSTNERANAKKLFFPMCHNSWLRRLVFRLIEETPDITTKWIGEYGIPADEALTRNIIDLKPNDIVISQPSEMGIEGYDIVDDANAMFRYINKYTYEDIELEEIKRLRNNK